MSVQTYITSDRLPREVVPGLFWLGGCSSSEGWPGRETRRPIMHEPNSAFLLVGTKKTLMIDTGHFGHWYAIQSQLDIVLKGRPLDYVVPTHPEIPHAGNLGRLLLRYPDAIALGDIRDYHLFYPQIARERLVSKVAGDVIDLGGLEFVFIEPVWRDLTATIWGYETTHQALFSSDGVGFLHEHEPDVCGLLADELPPELPITDEKRFALPFMAMVYQDMRPSTDEFRALLARYPVRIICSSHSAPFTGAIDFDSFIDALLRATVDPERVIGARVGAARPTG